VLGNGPGKAAIGELGGGGLAFGDDLEIIRRRAVIAGLDQPASGDRLGLDAAALWIGQRAGEQQAEVLPGSEHCERALIGIGRDHDFGEDARNRARGRLIEHPVERDDPAERRYRVAGKGGGIGLLQRRRGRDAAGVGVLDDHHAGRGIAKFADQFERGVGIVEVVVAERLALHLARLADTGSRGAGGGVKGRLLMRILAVSKRRTALERDRQRLGEKLPLVGETEPARDHAVIARGGGEGARGETLAELEAGRAAAGVHLGDQFGIVGGIGDDRHERMVLRSRTDHRRPADIDILDDFGPLGALHHRLEEGIEIDHDEIDHPDRVALGRSHMPGIVAHREQPAMDFGMKRLDPAIHHLGKARQVGNVANRKPRVAQRRGGAAGRNQFDPVAGERLAEFDDPGLVRDRKKRARDFDVIHGAPSPGSGALRQAPTSPDETPSRH